MDPTTPYLSLVEQVSALFAPLPEVVAIALGGSRGAGGIAFDDRSDIDLEIYTRGDIGLEVRERIVMAAGAPSPDCVGRSYWGAADEWPDAATGLVVDASYFDAGWMSDQLDRILVRHEPSLGYSTCFWHTIRGAAPLHDPEGWLSGLKDRAEVPYPEELRGNVIAHNRGALRGFPSAWEVQVEKAAVRGDIVSVNNRVAGLMASYFDVLFAFNRVPHPGEKRLLEAVARLCPLRPDGMAADVEAVLAAASSDLAGLPERVARLLDALDGLLAAGEPAVGGA